MLPKHLKPTKQLLDPFPSLSRNGFWLHVGSRKCRFPQNPGKRMAPHKSDNHNNSNYSDVKEFDGNSNSLILAQGKQVGTIATMLLELALCRCTDPAQPPPTPICRFRDFCGLTKQTVGTYRISSRC